MQRCLVSLHVITFLVAAILLVPELWNPLQVFGNPKYENLTHKKSSSKLLFFNFSFCATIPYFLNSFWKYYKNISCQVPFNKTHCILYKLKQNLLMSILPFLWEQTTSWVHLLATQGRQTIVRKASNLFHKFDAFLTLWAIVQLFPQLIWYLWACFIEIFVYWLWMSSSLAARDEYEWPPCRRGTCTTWPCVQHACLCSNTLVNVVRVVSRM